MSTETKEGREIFEKFHDHNGKRYRGLYIAHGDGRYTMKIQESKTVSKKVEETLKEIVTQRVEKLRPFGKMSAAARNEIQTKIDAWLEKGRTISQALEEKTVGKGKNVKTVRAIEVDLESAVERYYEEEKTVVSTPLVKMSDMVTFDDIAEVPMFVKLLGKDFRKSLINYVNSINK